MAAGYSAKTAYSIGEENLRKPEIAEAVAEGKAALAKRARISQDAVVERLAALAFADLRDVADWGPGRFRLKDSAGLPPEAAASVREITVQANAGAASPTLRMTIKQHDQIQALRLLGQHLGMFKDRVELDVRAAGFDGLLGRLRLAVHGELLERALESGDLNAARHALTSQVMSHGGGAGPDDRRPDAQNDSGRAQACLTRGADDAHPHKRDAAERRRPHPGARPSRGPARQRPRMGRVRARARSQRAL